MKLHSGCWSELQSSEDSIGAGQCTSKMIYLYGICRRSQFFATWPHLRLLECPLNMVHGFAQCKSSKWETDQDRSLNAIYDLLLEVIHWNLGFFEFIGSKSLRLAHTQSRGLDCTLWGDCQRISGHMWNHSVSSLFGWVWFGFWFWFIRTTVISKGHNNETFYLVLSSWSFRFCLTRAPLFNGSRGMRLGLFDFIVLEGGGHTGFLLFPGSWMGSFPS